MPHGPSPTQRYPMPGITRLVFLKNVLKNPAIQVGDFTYYDDPEGPEGFERNVLYHFDFIGDCLIIGKFCQIAAGARFIMNGGNHRMNGFSTYPFPIFGQGWKGHFEGELDVPFKGDTVIGNDVWIGHDALFMPGVRVGDGAIIGTRAVVTQDVPPYAVVGGNPARLIRYRFDDATIAALLRIRWWEWDIAKITRNLPAIGRTDLAALEAAS